jgi:arabinogalactan endo-1,4-beta-galactosidase
MNISCKNSPQFLISLFLFILCCSSQGPGNPPVEEGQDLPDLIYGADLSYVNQILDKGGVFRQSNIQDNPYNIFAKSGTELVRLRLWHNPQWTKTVYGNEGTQLYNDLKDVERSMVSAKGAGMKVLLDFHYSDEWADPGKQFIPAAWKQIRSVDVLADSVYNYTLKTLEYLKSKDLQPEYVQVGNETNCGMFFSEAPTGFPTCNVCNGDWTNMVKVVNAGLRAIADVNATSDVKTKTILHVADPKNLDWWFTNMTSNGVAGYDIIGFSFYPLWHTAVPLEQISETISSLKKKFSKDLMILETAYPWTLEGSDSYNNQFGSQQALQGYPFTPEGQYDFMKKLAREVGDGGGLGVIYWEPAWISSPVKDLWGTGSSWENCAYFDFEGNALKVFDYMKEEK